ncbi:MAG: hypothetical protein ACLQVM_02255 [Terriglobia bacterium]
MRNRNRLLVRAILIFLLLQFLPATAAAGDPEFQALADRVSAYYQKRPMRGMGLLSFIANRFAPHGVGHFEMAIFDDVTSPRTAPGEELESSLQGLVGPDYQPFVRARDNRSGDLTVIYIRESGKKSFEMLIVSIDSMDTVLMKMRLNPDAMREWMDEPVEKGKGSGHRGGSSAGK